MEWSATARLAGDTGEVMMMMYSLGLAVRIVRGSSGSGKQGGVIEKVRERGGFSALWGSN